DSGAWAATDRKGRDAGPSPSARVLSNRVHRSRFWAPRCGVPATAKDAGSPPPVVLPGPRRSWNCCSSISCAFWLPTLLVFYHTFYIDAGVLHIIRRRCKGRHAGRPAFSLRLPGLSAAGFLQSVGGTREAVRSDRDTQQTPW